MERTRKFLFVWWEGGGNIPPAVHLVRQLVGRGHEVRVLGDPVSQKTFQEAGASYTTYRRAPRRMDLKPENDPLKDWEAQTPKQALATLRDRLFFGPAREYAQDTLEEIERYSPDAMAIMDFTMGAMLAAEAARIPSAVIAPHILMYPVPGRPPVGPGLLPPRTLAHKMQQWVISKLTMRELAKALPEFNRVRGRFGLGPVQGVFEQVERMDRMLVMTSPSLDLPGGPLPANVRYTGPVLVDPGWTEPCLADWPSGQRNPLVLLSLSSTYQNQAPVVERAIEALGQLPVRGIVTLGPALEAARFKAPPNVVICSSAPHSQILPFADAMITHCGHGSVVRALAHDVPLICVPMGRDQNDIAARVVYHGAGVRVAPSASMECFARAVESVLAKPCYGRGAKWLGEAIRRDAADSTAIAELERLAATRDASRVILNEPQGVEQGQSHLAAHSI